MNQLSFKIGLKRWGKKSRAEINSKMNQLYMRYTSLRIHWENMSHEQKKQTLESQFFLKRIETKPIKK